MIQTIVPGRSSENFEPCSKKKLKEGFLSNIDFWWTANCYYRFSSDHRGAKTVRAIGSWIQWTWFHGCQQFHDLDRTLHGLWEGPEKRDRDVLFQFLTAKRRLTPMSQYMLQELLPDNSAWPVYHPESEGGTIQPLCYRKGQETMAHPQKKWRPSHGYTL